MLQHLYNRLAHSELKYHKLAAHSDERIFLTATSLDPKGVDEVMRIKELADHLKLHAKWDGLNVEIAREPLTEGEM